MKTVKSKTLLVFAGLSGVCAVILGAFGAHMLKAELSEKLMATYQTGVAYHFYHTLALLCLAVLLQLRGGSRFLYCSGILFIVGIVLFSGSLYALALSGQTWIGIFTPIGGVCFIVAWFLLVLEFLSGEDEA